MQESDNNIYKNFDYEHQNVKRQLPADNVLDIAELTSSESFEENADTPATREKKELPIQTRKSVIDGNRFQKLARKSQINSAENGGRETFLKGKKNNNVPKMKEVRKSIDQSANQLTAFQNSKKDQAFMYMLSQDTGVDSPVFSNKTISKGNCVNCNFQDNKTPKKQTKSNFQNNENTSQRVLETQETEYFETEGDLQQKNNENYQEVNQVQYPAKPKKKESIKSSFIFYSLICSYTLVGACFGYSVNVMNPLLETIIGPANFDLSAAEMGMYLSIMSGFSWMGFQAATFIQPCVSHCSPVKVMNVTQIIQIASSLLVITGDKWILIVSRSTTFLCVNFLLIYGSMISYELAPADYKPLTQNFCVLMKSLGCLVAFILTDFKTEDHIFWRLALCAQAIFPFTCLLMNMTCLVKFNSPSYMIKNNNEAGCRKMFGYYLHDEEIEVMVSDIKKQLGKEEQVNLAKKQLNLSCCGNLKATRQEYKGQLRFGMYLGLSTLLTFYPAIQDFSSLIFVKDENDMSEKAFFTSLLPMFVTLQLIVTLLNFKLKLNQKRKLSIMVSQAVYALTWACLGVCYYIDAFDLAKFSCMLLLPLRDPLWVATTLTYINDTCPAKIWSTSYIAEQSQGVVFAFTFPFFIEDNQNFKFIAVLFSIINVFMFFCSYFVLFETNGLTREQIEQRFASKNGKKNITSQQQVAQPRALKSARDENDANTQHISSKYQLKHNGESGDPETFEELPNENDDKIFTIGSNNPRIDNFTLEQHAEGQNYQTPNFNKMHKVIQESDQQQNFNQMHKVIQASDQQQNLNQHQFERLEKAEKQNDYYKNKAKQHKSHTKELKKQLKQQNQHGKNRGVTHSNTQNFASIDADVKVSQDGNRKLNDHDRNFNSIEAKRLESQFFTFEEESEPKNQKYIIKTEESGTNDGGTLDISVE